MVKEKELYRLLSEASAGVPVEEINSETVLRSELGIDSIRLVDVCVSIEDLFEIELSESDLDPSSISKVEDLRKMVGKYL